MNDETRESADAQADGPLAGERLAEARRLKQISLPDIARELHLDEGKVQALEQNRFDVLGAPVFAKGHLRKYAELVGVPIEDILADYYVLNRASGAPPVVGPPRHPARDINLGPWLVVVPLVLIALGIAWWWLGRAPTIGSGTPPPASTSEPVESAAPPGAAMNEQAGDPEPVLSVPAAADGGPSVPTDEPPGDPAAGQEAPLAVPAAAEPVPSRPAAAVERSPEPATRVVSGSVSLRLSYSGDCWTEVSDANGDRLFFDLGRAGRTVNVSGPGPLRVLLGDAGNVDVRVNGEPYTIAAADLRGATARFSVAGQAIR